MKQWNVLVCVTREYEYQVEAESEEEARDLAADMAQRDVPSDFVVTYDPEVAESWALDGDEWAV